MRFVSKEQVFSFSVSFVKLIQIYRIVNQIFRIINKHFVVPVDTFDHISASVYLVGQLVRLFSMV